MCMSCYNFGYVVIFRQFSLLVLDNSCINKLDKLNKLNVFIKNRLEKLMMLCQEYPVTFSFVDGIDNHADCITRPLSHKQLMKSTYYTGPSFLVSADCNMSRADILDITVPNPLMLPNVPQSCSEEQSSSVLHTVVSEPATWYLLTCSHFFRGGLQCTGLCLIM